MKPSLALLSRLAGLSLALGCCPAHATGAIAFDTRGLSGDETLTYSEIVADDAAGGAARGYDAGGDATGGAAGDRGEDQLGTDDAATPGATSRFAGTDGVYHPSRTPIAAAGPFFLVAADTIEMIGAVDARSPRQFADMLAAHPGIARLVMIECPGSVDEDANHVLAREVRAAGLATIVPDGGSVRSGAVDLFLAGTRRIAAPSAEFGVHSWRDDEGHEPADFAADDPVNADYIRYYRDMGLSDSAARQFYALTNSVPFDDVRTLSAADMARLGLTDIMS